MIVACRQPVLILEGDGDKIAVPHLIRKTLHHHNVFDLNPAPRPMAKASVPKLARDGELERWIRHATNRDGDSVLLALDTDDDCPFDVAKVYAERVRGLMPALQKKIGIVFFNSEFETLFLFCLTAVAATFPDFKWNLKNYDPTVDFEQIRGAKETIIGYMASNRAYKETRDQVRFIEALDFDLLRTRSRSFRHFENTLLWLAGRHESDQPVYPAI